MITVRFPTGFSIQYNGATYVDNSVDGVSRIYTKKDGLLLAYAPRNSTVIEWSTPPCRMYQAMPAESDALLALTKEIRSLKRKLGVKP